VIWGRLRKSPTPEVQKDGGNEFERALSYQEKGTKENFEENFGYQIEK